MAVWRTPAWVVDFLSDCTTHAAGHVVDVARPRQRRIPARPRSAEFTLAADPGPEPIWNEVGTPVIHNLVFEPVHHRIALLHAIVRREREEQSVSASHDRPIVEAEIHSYPRRDVVAVVRKIAAQE